MMTAEPTRAESQRFWNAMVVGGEGSFVSNKLTKSLLKHGIRVVEHVDWYAARPPSRLPLAVDLVYICTDMVSHKLSEPCMNLARSENIPYVNGTRKWAESIKRLTQAGFPLLPQATQAQDEQIIEAVASPVEATDEQDVNTTITTQEEVMTTTATDNTTAETQAQTGDAAPIGFRFSLSHPKQRAYLMGLIRFPTATNDDLWASICDDPALKGHSLDYSRCKWARIQLGIRVDRAEGGRVINIDRDKFADTAISLGANDCKIPEPQYVLPLISECKIPRPAQDEQKEAKAEKPAAVQTDQVKAAEGSPLRSALLALRAVMKDMGMVELLITESEVKYKQVRVVEETYNF